MEAPTHPVAFSPLADPIGAVVSLKKITNTPHSFVSLPLAFAAAS
jgi:hypothetical protein